MVLNRFLPREERKEEDRWTRDAVRVSRGIDPPVQIGTAAIRPALAMAVFLLIGSATSFAQSVEKKPGVVEIGTPLTGVPRSPIHFRSDGCRRVYSARIDRT
ncbi:MAG TPA: hypothetical protein VLZ81_18385, partial [Blastocatellia bacterium]|nr:hypothetical protein [Blastocatellia bacterium]